MKLFHLDLNDAKQAVMPPSVATIGFFDGVHRGHRYLIDDVKARAGSMGGMQSTVITFDAHPRLCCTRTTVRVCLQRSTRRWNGSL